MSTAVYRARSATELIDAAFQLLRSNAGPLLTLSALIGIPAFALRWAVLGTMGTTGVGAAINWSGLFLVFVLASLWSAILSGPMTLGISDAFLGRPIVVADVLRRGLPRAPTMIGIFIAGTILISIGLVLLVVPGIIIALLLFAAIPVAVLEGAGVVTAISRSFALSNGLKGHVFVTGFLACVILIIGYLIIGAAGGALQAVTRVPFVLPLFQVVGNVLLYPLLPIVFTLQYYDARIRKEGFDIQLMAQQVAGGATPQPAV